MLNLDTHVLVFALVGELTERERTLLSQARWSISAIVLWELTKLCQLGRLTMDLDGVEVRRRLTRLHIWPITLDVCRAIPRLSFRGDPADELIAATSVVHGVPLLTRDRRLLAAADLPLA